MEYSLRNNQPESPDRNGEYWFQGRASYGPDLPVFRVEGKVLITVTEVMTLAFCKGVMTHQNGEEIPIGHQTEEVVLYLNTEFMFGSWSGPILPPWSRPQDLINRGNPLPPQRDFSKLREALADYAHRAWAGWMEYMFTKGITQVFEHPDGSQSFRWTIDLDLYDRWHRQIHTSFENLPHSETLSDYNEADQMLALMHLHLEKLEGKSDGRPEPTNP